jgi:hypothetical protein
VKSKNKQRGFIDFKGIGTFLIGLGIAAGIVIGGVIFVVIPWAWQYVKPWIHQITG